MKFKLSLIAALGLLASSTAFAAPSLVPPSSDSPILNYNYVEAAYQWIDPNNSALNTSNGLTSTLSYSPTEYFFLETGYDYGQNKFKYTSDTINLNAWRYGIGGYYPICENLHAVGTVGGIRAWADSDNLDSYQNGGYVGAQLRYAADDDIEVSPYVTYTYFTDDKTWSYGVDTLFAVADHAGLVADVGLDEHGGLQLTGGARLTW